MKGLEEGREGVSRVFHYLHGQDRDLSKICLKPCPFRNARKRFSMWQIDDLVIYHLSLAVYLSCMVFLSE